MTFNVVLIYFNKKNSFHKSYWFMFCACMMEAAEVGLERHLKQLWLSWVSLPNNGTCWNGGAAPLNKLRVALGDQRNLPLIRLTANQESEQAVNQARKASQQWGPARFIIYFPNWCISLSQGCLGGVAGVEEGGGGGLSNMINNWYAVWKSWFAASLVRLSLAVVRTHLLWWQIWRSAQQHHVLLGTERVVKGKRGSLLAEAPFVQGRSGGMTYQAPGWVTVL